MVLGDSEVVLGYFEAVLDDFRWFFSTVLHGGQVADLSGGYALGDRYTSCPRKGSDLNRHSIPT